MAQQTALRGVGDLISWKNQTGGSVTVGTVVAVGKLFGVLVSGLLTTDTTLANNTIGTVALTGMYELPKLTTDTFVEGAALYWDATNSRVTTTAGANTFVGCAGEIGTNGQTRVDVRLNATINGIDGGDTQVGADASHAVPFIIKKTFPDQATADVTIYNVTAPFQFRVLDVLVENQAANGANANTVQVCKAAAGASPISDAMSLNGKAANDLVRAAAIQTANATIAAGGSLFIRQTKAGGTMGGVVRILCERA